MREKSLTTQLGATLSPHMTEAGRVELIHQMT